MKWTEIRIKTTEEAADAVSEMLTSIGAGGVAIEDPNDIRREIAKPNTLDYADEEFVNALGEDVLIKAYFPGEMSQNELAALVREKIHFISNFLDVGEGYIGYGEVDEEDWANGWKKYYKPLHISERVVIKPSWEEYTPAEGEAVVEMDPGMAFGTGTHETTRMCAQLLEMCLNPGDTVIDVGCGTGILSIVASRLGAGQVTAVDIDEVAVRVTRENCLLNHVENVLPLQGVIDDIPVHVADVMVANIIANVIINIADTVPRYLKRRGMLVTSGIIRERKDEVVEKYLSLGFTLEKTMEMGEWVAMVFQWQSSL